MSKNDNLEIFRDTLIDTAIAVLIAGFVVYNLFFFNLIF